jgi:hypothetical protein
MDRIGAGIGPKLGTKLIGRQRQSLRQIVFEYRSPLPHDIGMKLAADEKHDDEDFIRHR